jgi:hypothetical protein
LTYGSRKARTVNHLFNGRRANRSSSGLGFYWQRDVGQYIRLSERFGVVQSKLPPALLTQAPDCKITSLIVDQGSSISSINQNWLFAPFLDHHGVHNKQRPARQQQESSDRCVYPLPLGGKKSDHDKHPAWSVDNGIRLAHATCPNLSTSVAPLSSAPPANTLKATRPARQCLLRSG